VKGGIEGGLGDECSMGMVEVLWYAHENWRGVWMYSKKDVLLFCIQ
jgi:hypothetical protein